jgi:hypothetical protein
LPISLDRTSSKYYHSSCSLIRSKKNLVCSWVCDLGNLDWRFEQKKWKRFLEQFWRVMVGGNVSKRNDRDGSTDLEKKRNMRNEINRKGLEKDW